MVQKEDLIREAKTAMNKSYAPFSKVKVGACVMTSKGKCYTGSNYDRDAYKTKFYAERKAIEEAYSHNDKEITKIVIASSTPEFSYPNGSTRQMIYEFAPHADIILVNSFNEEKLHTIQELLPFPSKRI
ncbi:MAG: cytidine deaminase [Clostridia bacterium]|nr:cytidine deaminase [Clostridia bacterium]